MKLIVQTLSNQHYSVEIGEKATVLELKQKIHAEHALGEVNDQKLISSGKVLKDDQTIESAKLKPDAVVVLMVKKAAASTPATASTTASSTSSTTSTKPQASAPIAFGPAPVRATAMGHSSPFVAGCSFRSHRSPLLARHGAVCSAQPLASQVGLDLLKAGANAAEACIGVAAALNLLEPGSTGIGGDCFAIYFDAATGRVEGLNGSGRSPMALDPSKLTPQDINRNGTGMHPLSAHCVTVPGSVAGWCDTLERWGSRKFTMSDLLAPVITMAREGVPIAPLTAESWSRAEGLLRSKNELPCSLLPGGVAPGAGELHRNPDLADSFESIARYGKAGFYEGRIGRAIVDSVQSRGGLLTLDDLARHTSTFPNPISVNYKGVDVWEIPPNGQGLTALMALNILSALEEKAAAGAGVGGDSTPLAPLASLGHNSGEYLHRVVESLRLAFADTRYFVCDSDHEHARGDDDGRTHAATLRALLSMEYARERAERFDPARTNLNHPYGSPANSSSTVSFVIVDAAGNACSFIQSIYAGYGSGIVVPGCGFLLQNRGANFTLDKPDAVSPHPNRLAGGKRPYHTIIPGLATKAGRLYAPFSVMGGFNQPQGHTQLLLNLIEFGLDPQAAVDAPRFCIESGTAGGDVLVEDDIDEKAREELRKKGHVLEVVSGYERIVFGRGQAIRRIEPDGVLWCGSDGRADGAPAGY